MKRLISLLVVAVLVAALASPALALAGNGNGKGKGNNKDRGPAVSVSDGAKGAQQKAASQDKTARKAPKAPKAPGGKSARVAAGPISPERSVESTKAVGPGVANAFSRITANIEKSLAKIAAGTKKQVPPGLIRVWLKFAGWLGVDATTMPGAPKPGSSEPTGTIVPTSTVEPTGTVVPTETAGPSAVPAP